jgi:huntingtin
MKNEGHFYDVTREPIVYFIRFLAYKYLLNPNWSSSSSNNNNNKNENNETKNKLKSDKEVKVIVKALALDCCSSAIAHTPHLLFKSLFVSSSKSSSNASSNNSLHIYDLLTYIKHGDDKMRTTTCLLIGQLINAVLINNNGNYDAWLHDETRTRTNNNDEDEARSFLNLETLVDHLMRFVRSTTTETTTAQATNNICKRSALTALHSFLPTLVTTKYAAFALDIVINLIHLKHSTYNLVKCELVDLFASLDFKSLNYIEQLLPTHT